MVFIFISFQVQRSAQSNVRFIRKRPNRQFVAYDDVDDEVSIITGSISGQNTRCCYRLNVSPPPADLLVMQG
ncbi:hypothetical protein Y032_0303g1883 [Ancylostoma ceylanicum]|uniref:Uncharacterized protein n=1 Tax=Ancylostoma ceylanicum TaxID=53326 RepID=A0A016S493_9BILA|nr:hypothetical protein Y032_0303g1883 [Ancylostoma ceylanicum]